MTKLFTKLLEDTLNEFSYDAQLAGLKYRIINTVDGMQLAVRGYDCKQSVLLKSILEKMANFNVPEERFQIIKEKVSAFYFYFFFFDFD